MCGIRRQKVRNFQGKPFKILEFVITNKTRLKKKKNLRRIAKLIFCDFPILKEKDERLSRGAYMFSAHSTKHKTRQKKTKKATMQLGLKLTSFSYTMNVFL